MTSTRLKAYGLLLIAAAIWGIAAIVIKLTLVGIDPIPFLIYRFGISSIIAILFFGISAKQIKIHSKADVITIALYGFLGTTVALGVLFLGLDITTVLNLSLITLATPLFAEVAGAIFLKEHLTKREKIGTIIAFLGTAIIIVQPILENGLNAGNLRGNILALCYLLADTAAIILLKKLLRKKYSASVLTHSSFIIGLFTVIPLGLLIMPGQEIISQIINLPFQYHFGVLYMAIFSGTVAYYLRALGQKSIEVGEASLFGYLTPVISTILAILILGDQITATFILGAVVIIAGVALAEYKAKLL